MYRTVVRDVRYIRDGSGDVRGRANVVLRSATAGDRLFPFKVAPSVVWVGFAPKPDFTSIGHDVLGQRWSVNCDSFVESVDFRGLPNVLTIGNWFLYGCYSLTTIDLSPLSKIWLVRRLTLTRCRTSWP